MTKRRLNFEKIFERLPNHLAGHAWTVAPALVPPKRYELPTPIHWENWFIDPEVGRVGTHGLYHPFPGSHGLCILVHGLGGTPNSHYVVEAAQQLYDLGYSTLRIGLRGSNGIGNDLYSARSTQDIIEAINHPLFKKYDAVYIVGYSLGGLITLQTATENLPKKVRGVAAICAPIDLVAGSKAFEQKEKWFYRRYLLLEMYRMHYHLTHERKFALDSKSIRDMHSFRTWDDAFTIRRWGYESVESYYKEASIYHRLDELTVPAVYLYTAHDPMVVADTIEPHLASDYPKFKPFRVETGGHLYLPDEVDLGFNSPKTLFGQLLAALRNLDH